MNYNTSSNFLENVEGIPTFPSIPPILIEIWARVSLLKKILHQPPNFLEIAGKSQPLTSQDEGWDPKRKKPEFLPRLRRRGTSQDISGCLIFRLGPTGLKFFGIYRLGDWGSENFGILGGFVFNLNHSTSGIPKLAFQAPNAQEVIKIADHVECPHTMDINESYRVVESVKHKKFDR